MFRRIVLRPSALVYCSAGIHSQAALAALYIVALAELAAEFAPAHATALVAEHNLSAHQERSHFAEVAVLLASARL